MHALAWVFIGATVLALLANDDGVTSLCAVVVFVVGLALAIAVVT